MSGDEYFRLIRNAQRFIILFLALSLAVFIGLAFFTKGGILDVIGIMSSAIIPIYLLAFAFEFLSYVLRFFKWRYFLRVLKLKIPPVKNFIVYMSLYSMDLTPGEIGRSIAAYTLTRISSTKLACLLPIISMDIFTDSLGLVALSIFIGIMFPGYAIIIITADVILTLPYLLIISPWLFNILKAKILKGRLSKVFETYGEEYFISQSKFNNVKMYATSMLFTVPATIANSLSIYFVLLSLHINAAVLKSIAVFTISTLIGIASFIPGTIGSSDVAMSALTSSTFHLNLSTSAAVTIMTRVVLVWFDVLLGTAFLLYSFRYWKNPAKPKNPLQSNK